MCDGYKLKEGPLKNSAWRNGQIAPAHVALYEEYIAGIRDLCTSDLAFRNAEALVLEERHGFGFAVKRALERVVTPCVMVLQHDRRFVQPVPLLPLVQVLLRPFHPLSPLSSKHKPTTSADVELVVDGAKGSFICVSVCGLEQSTGGLHGCLHRPPPTVCLLFHITIHST